MLEILLIGDKNLSLKDLEKVNHIGSTKSYYCDDLRYVVEFGDVISARKHRHLLGLSKNHLVGSYADHIRYVFGTSSEEWVFLEFSEEDMAKVPFKAEVFIIMEFRHKETMKRILRQLDFPQNIYVEDNYGSILPLSEFNKLDWKPGMGNIYPKD